jgi:vacuolar-type H+-ATPase subunit F/Vma7
MTVAALGEHDVIVGYGLAGVRLLPADGAGDVLRAWDSLPAGTTLLLVSTAAREVLGDLLAARRLVWLELTDER